MKCSPYEAANGVVFVDSDDDSRSDNGTEYNSIYDSVSDSEPDEDFERRFDDSYKRYIEAVARRERLMPHPRK